MENEIEEERMLKWFAWEHLSPRLQLMGEDFHKLAEHIAGVIEPGPERTVTLRKLLEAKDAALRALIHPGG